MAGKAERGQETAEPTDHELSAISRSLRCVVLSFLTCRVVKPTMTDQGFPLRNMLLVPDPTLMVDFGLFIQL